MNFCLWEMIDGVDWKKSLNKIIEFDSIDMFVYYWKFLPHNNFSNFASTKVDSNKYIANMYEIESKPRKIGSICVFRKGIRPEWEDKNCKYGGCIMFKKAPIQSWTNLVCLIISSQDTNICGVRIADKYGDIRLEVWLKNMSKTEDINIIIASVKEIIHEFNPDYNLEPLIGKHGEI